MAKYLVLILLLITSLFAQAVRTPEPWPKDDAIKAGDSGVLKDKNKTFHYITGWSSLGGGHYALIIRLTWKKESDLAYDAELSDFIVDSTLGELSMKNKVLKYKTEFREAPTELGGERKISTMSYCWLFDEKEETFTAQDTCPKSLKKNSSSILKKSN
ncbi:MAG: hypothetical protein HUU57_08395 [Bdellovibrio sp.]|nr:hypothetical protein [Bdellovibrio sp.]